jgi:hypothetical protein
VYKANDIASRSLFVLNADGEDLAKRIRPMATPGQLVECVATALNVPHATVVLYDRVLAENGLRSKGGRGKSAAKVTAEDAANLLIAIAGNSSDGINSAAATVERFSRLKYGRQADWRALISENTPPELVKAAEEIRQTDFMKVPGMDHLRSDHSFRDGLIALIEAVRQRKIIFKTRDDRAYVSLEGSTFIQSNISVSLGEFPRADARYEPSGKSADFSDLNWRQTFSHRTILAVARLLGLEDARTAKSKKKAA